MKDAITYANDAGFFSFNVIGWKAEFERLINAVRADVLEEIKTQEPVAKVRHELDGHIGWNPKLESLPEEGAHLYSHQSNIDIGIGTLPIPDHFRDATKKVEPPKLRRAGSFGD